MRIKKSLFTATNGSRRAIAASPTYLSNGVWMVRREALSGILRDVPQSKLESYLCRQSHPDRLNWYEDARMKKVLPKSTHKRIERTNTTHEVYGPTLTLVLFSAFKLKVWFDQRYVEAFDLTELVGSKPEGSWQTLDKTVCLMPCRGPKEDAK